MKVGGAGIAAASAAMVALTFALVPRFAHGMRLPEMAAGWLLAVSYHGVALWMNGRAFGGQAGGFFLWGLAGNVLRFAALVAIIIASKFVPGWRIDAFAATVVIGFLAFSANEIRELCVSRKGSDDGGQR